jgi:hypothetical protein
MSIKSALSGFFDNSGLADTFARKPRDVAKARKPLLTGIANAKRQFTQTPREPRGPNKWWQLNNGVVALTVKLKGDTFDINGATTNHLPEAQFEAFLDQFAQAVAAGEFDEELANHGKGSAAIEVPAPAEPAPATPASAASRRGTISPEAAKARGIKAAESRARNRAAKAGPAKK